MRSSKSLKFLFPLIVALVLSFDVPKGWQKAGSAPGKYDMGLDFGMGRTSKYAATIQSNTYDFGMSQFGTLMQSFSPDKYVGKRIKMTGFMKSQNVRNWAGFWLRVDGKKQNKSLSFDNMFDRPVTGTTTWRQYEIILDVPKGATNIAFGALLDGVGKIWFDDIRFEEVSSTTATTGKDSKTKKEAPENLDFEE